MQMARKKKQEQFSVWRSFEPSVSLLNIHLAESEFPHEFTLAAVPITRSAIAAVDAFSCAALGMADAGCAL